MQHKIIELNGKKSLFSYPSSPSDIISIRANCHRSFGCFTKGDTKGLDPIEANNKGLLYGKSLSLALVWLEEKVLTIPPHYESEQFISLYGFPVDGDVHSRLFTEKSSSLTNFLIRSQSKDRFLELLKDFEIETVKDWVNGGMKGDVNEFVSQNIFKKYQENLINFYFAKSTSIQYGDYYFLASSIVKPVSEFDKASLQASIEITKLQQENNRICSNPIIERCEVAPAALTGNNPKLLNQSEEVLDDEVSM